MSKYTGIQKDLDEVLGANQSYWSANNILVSPANVRVDGNYDVLLVPEVLASAMNDHSFQGIGVRGLIIIQIYTKVGIGSLKGFEVADYLDTILQNKTLSRGTKTSTSYVNTKGVDNADTSLYRMDYELPFYKVNS